jgi:hypothetical protein
VSVLAGDKAVGGVTGSYKQVEADTGRIDVTVIKLEYMNNIGAYSNAHNNLKQLYRLNIIVTYGLVIQTNAHTVALFMKNMMVQ